MGINQVKIDEVLESLAIANEKRFNAHQVASLANESDVLKVNEYLLYKSLGNFGILDAKIETLCDNGHPDEHFNVGEPLPDYEIECHVCGNEYIPDLEFSHLVFYFKDEYLNDVKKKLENHQKILELSH